jgi:hypothetical protein
VHDVSEVRQIEAHMAEPLVPGPSRLEVEIAIAKLKKHKSPGSNQILRPINPLILFGIRNNFLMSGRSILLYQFTKRVTKLAVIIIVGYHCYQLHTKCYRMSSSQG